MATKKAAAKKAVKPVAKKTVKAPAKKAVAKAVKPTPKKAAKPIAKPKNAVVKKAVKPVAKKTVKHVAPKPAPKKVAPAAKKIVPVAKKPTPVVKPVAKAATHKPVVPVPKKVSKPAGPKAIAKNPKDIKVIPAKPVSLPKISTKTSRKYQPDFTKSVLDQLKHDPGAPIVRYSDSDLTEFRELIQRKLEAAKKELSYLQGLITRKDEMGGDESENRYMTMEDGSLSMEREQLSQMASRQITFIDHLEKALMRIENKTYGICRVTGKLIDKARLRAVPHATLSIEAKMGQAK
ncbi:MAG: TraR/DksA family transcriptional regulator [Niastella sp.]|nr:TraR/DksA family transcriptional regulator [Niastella sp.]